MLVRLLLTIGVQLFPYTIVTVSKSFAVKETFFRDEYERTIYVYIILFLKCSSFRQLISSKENGGKKIYVFK